MSEINDLDTTDASNTARFPEGQAPSTVNNGARALEGLLARWASDFGDGSITTGGTSTAYTVASNRTVSAYYDGLTLMVEWHTASGASPTVNVDSLGAKSLVWPNGTAIAADDLPANGRALIQYDGTNFQVLTNTLLIDDAGLLADLLGSTPYTGDLNDLLGDLSNGGQSVRQVGTGAANTPSGVTVNTSMIVTRRFSSADGHQIFYEANSTNVFMRTFSTTWGSWTQIDASAAETNAQQLAKGWVNFDGTGTLSVRDSFNVSSVTDNGTGDYTVNWDTNFANAQYAVTMFARRSSGSVVGAQGIHSITAGSVRVITADTAGSPTDHDIVCVVAFGDQ